MIPEEILGSKLTLHTGLQHPMTKILMDIGKKAHPFDLRPLEGVSMTILIALESGYGVTLAFGLEEAKLSTSYRDITQVESIWRPTLICGPSQYAYVVQDNRRAIGT